MIQRLFYRLPELAGRWKCTVEDLLHLGAQGRAQVCVDLVARDFHGVLSVKQDFEGEIVEWTEWCDLPRGVFAISRSDAREMETPGAFPFALTSGLRYAGDHADLSVLEVTFPVPLKVQPSDLCMLHSEVLRLDRKEFDNEPTASSGEEPGVAAVLSPRAESTYLNIIGAMLELVLGKTPAGKPQSVFESQAAVIEALIVRNPNAPGISKTTLEDKFAKGRRHLNST